MPTRLLCKTLVKNYLVEHGTEIYLVQEEWSMNPDRNIMLDRTITLSSIQDGTMAAREVTDKEVKESILEALEEYKEKQNSAIEIVAMLTPPSNSEANWGKLEKVRDPYWLINYFECPMHFTDDEIFIDGQERRWTIDELIGKIVRIGDKEIEVKDAE